MIDLPVVELAQRLERGETTSLALTRAYLERIEQRRGLNAYVTVTAERALAEARQADTDRGTGVRGPLLGIPYALKDLVDTANVPTTWGTRALLRRVPARDAVVQAKLRAAGAVLLGKLSMTELANAFGNAYPLDNHGGAIRNPWNPAWWAGGSSAGSGAATAASLCAFAIGSETWGSIDSPAATCGVTGLRPTYDIVSRVGCMPLSYTLDKIGVLARDARDTGIVLDAIAERSLDDPPQTFRIGIVDSKGTAFTPEYDSAWARAVEVIRALGVAESLALEVDQSHGDAMTVILAAERDVAFEGFVRDGYNEQLYDRQPWREKQRTPATAVDYVQAQRVRAAVQREWQERFARFDVIVCAGRAGPPVPADGTYPKGKFSLSHPRVLVDGNLAGLPAITLPMGFTSDGFPLSMHAVASPYEDRALVAFAAAYQARTAWHQARPR